MTELIEDDFKHLCFDVTDEPGGIRILAACRAETYTSLSHLLAKMPDGSTVPLFHRALDRMDGLQFYEVLIARNALAPGMRFDAVNRRGRSTRVWSAGTMIEPPSGWRFTKYHLNLTFDEVSPEPEPPSRKTFLRSIKVVDGDLRVSLTTIGAPDPEMVDVVIYKFRDEGLMHSERAKIAPARTIFRTSHILYDKLTGHRGHTVEVSIPLAAAFVGNGLYSMMIKVDDLPLRGIFPYNRYYGDKQSTFSHSTRSGVSLVHHFADVVSGNIRLEYFSFDNKVAREALQLIDPSRSVRHAKTKWLICEYTNMARDNGIALFRHIQNKRPDVDAHYVIDRNNHDGIVPDGRAILEYGSIEHLRACREASAVLFTHHSIYGFPSIMRRAVAKDAVRPISYFLQHGVLAIKPMLGDYRKSATKYDLFNVSSPRERTLVERKCGYRSGEITVAGLPRWDNLLARSLKTSPQDVNKILIFPTWRAGLDKLDLDAFVESEFYRQWHDALSAISSRALAQHQTVLFCSHSIIQRFNDLFNFPGVTNCTVKEAIEHLPEVKVFITDYSSLCFDALYIGRPTIFFMPDQTAYFAAEPSYVDVERQLPGPIVNNVDTLVRTLFGSKGVREVMSPQLLAERKRLYMQQTDLLNCERVITATIKATSAKP